jgi:hypothetical protein
MALIEEGHIFQGKSNKVNGKLDKVKEVAHRMRWHFHGDDLANQG